MKVKTLIARLQKLPPNADVMYVWDGAARSLASYVWQGKNGKVLIGSNHCDPVYYDEDMPIGLTESTKKHYYASTCSYVYWKINK